MRVTGVQFAKWRWNEALRWRDRLMLDASSLCVVSNDCWAGELYQWFGRPYDTPFIGLFLMGSDYARLVSDLDHYLGKPLRFVSLSRWSPELLDQPVNYPVGMLDDIEIHFMHYRDEFEAALKWHRRLERFDLSQARVKVSGGKAQVDRAVLEQVLACGHAPLVLVDPMEAELPGAVQVPGFTMNGADLFLPSAAVVNVRRWLESGEVRRPALTPWAVRPTLAG